MTKSYDEILKIGLVNISKNNYNESKKYFSKLLEIDKFRYEGYINLSNVFVLQDNQVKAIKLLKNYLDNIDSHPEIINALGIHYLNLFKYSELFKHVNLYIEKNDNYLLNYFMGFCLNNNGLVSNSRIYLEKSINLNNSFWPSYELLFKVYDLKGEYLKMQELADRSKKYFIDDPKYLYFKSLVFYRKLNFNKSLEILKTNNLESYFQKKEHLTYLPDFYDLLSKNYEKLLLHKFCLTYALKRNKTLISLEKNKGIFKEDLLMTINSYINFFNSDNKLHFKQDKKGIEHSNLVFLIGFPRSGTTLLDSILRSHSNTDVLEEKSYILNLRHNFFKKNGMTSLLNMGEGERMNIQKKYFASFAYDPNKITIDKFPLNLIELGFIKTIFPNSKIILAIRHPLDCILSCVLTSFKLNEAMLNFENLKTTSFFYNKVFNLLIKYINFFDLNLYKIKYENVVLDFDNEIKNLLNFLNLDFEDSINNFYDTAKKRDKIHTPSYDQVVKPLYSNSINKHLNFNEINTIKYDIKKWIDYFEYKKVKI